MEVINEELRIYRIRPEEMTIGQIRRHFSNFSDDCLVGHFSVYYDSKKDIVFFGSEADKQLEDFCIRMLGNMEQAKEVLPNYRKYAKSAWLMEVSAVLLNCITERLSKKPVRKPAKNPDSKFINIADDIFQISKIVSVRRRDEGSRCYIEVFITNRKASIRKEFPSKRIRDAEYDGIISILQNAA